MIKEVIMPKLGQTMEEGIIEKWRKKEGDRVEKGDILLEITTDKATLEVESYASGILKKIVRHQGETVPVTRIIAYIGDEEDEVPSLIIESPEQAHVLEKAKEEAAEIKEEEAAGARIKASPAARRIAREKKLDLALVKGTGPGGRITEKDVMDFKKISPIRHIIWERMSQSKREIPHYYLTASLDMGEAIETRKKLNQKFKDSGLKVSYNDFLIKASALAIAQYPAFNACIEGESIKERDTIDIGLAVSLSEGIIVPVIRNADKISFLDIVKERQALVEKARSNRLSPNEYGNGSFTISNLGAYNIDNFCAIINPPECAILAAASIIDTPSVVNGDMTIRPLMKVTLSLDHRIIDGAVGAAFLQRLKELVEAPEDYTKC